MVVGRATPQVRIAIACRTLGRAEVVRRCVTLLDGGAVEPAFVVTLGGRSAERLLARGVPSHQQYWLRVWGARGLLWAGPGDLDALRSVLADESWRVREMACKVIARYRLDDLLSDVAALDSDAVRRVRIAAARAVTRITRSED